MKAKFSKRLCIKCKYHGETSGGFSAKDSKGVKRPIHCNFAGVTGKTCLRANGAHDSYDIRGYEYHNCLLFEEGKAIKIK